MPKKLHLKPKPEACKGCPWYGDGTGFAPDELNLGATVLFMGARPDQEGEVTGIPFTGRTGKMIEANISKYGLRRKDASWANATRCRFSHTNYKPGNFYDAVAYCGNAFPRPDISQYRVVVPLDDEALMFCAGVNDVEVWRGSPFVPDAGMCAGHMVLPTPHPSAIFQNPRLRSASKGDFHRISQAARLGLEAFKYTDEFHMAEEPEQFLTRLEGLTQDPKQLVTIDVETDKKKPIDATLKIIGYAWGKDKAANAAWEVFSDDQLARLRGTIERATARLVTATSFDYSVLTKYGVQFPWAVCHDLTLLHSRWDVELPHSVAFIASTWTYRPFWKWLSDSEPYYYNCLDNAGEWEAFDRLERHCRAREPEVWQCYERDRKQIRTAVHVHLAGMPLEEEQFLVEKKLYKILRDDLETSLVSVFSETKVVPEEPKRCEKHKRYSGRSQLKVRKGEESLCSACLALQEYVAASKPLNLRSHAQMMELLESEGKKIPRTREKGSDGKYEMRKSFDKAAVKKLATEYADPRLFTLLDFREKDKVASSYFREAKTSPTTGRVHGVFGMHSAMHRWHCSEPNQQQVKKPERMITSKTPVEERERLARLLHENKLDFVNLEEPHGPRRAYITLPGRTFVGFDASALHYRIAGVLSGDPFISQTLERYDREQNDEYKPHIVNCCALFKVEPAQAIQWMHEEASQYTFSKNFIYMILNWGDTAALYQAAVAAKLDLDIKAVDVLKNNWLDKAHYYREWRERLQREAAASGKVALFDGRRRRYYGLRWQDGKWVADRDTVKEIGNHPLLGTEVSYVNPRLEKVMDFIESPVLHTRPGRYIENTWKLVLLSHDGFMLEGPEDNANATILHLMPMLEEPFPCGPGKVLRVPWAAKKGTCWAMMEDL